MSPGLGQTVNFAQAASDQQAYLSLVEAGLPSTDPRVQAAFVRWQTDLTAPVTAAVVASEPASPSAPVEAGPWTFVLAGAGVAIGLGALVYFATR